MRALARVLFAASLGAAAPVSAAGPIVLPIAFHIVEVDGHPVVDRTFIEQRLERANAIFAAYGVAFAEVPGHPLGAQHAAIESRADRDALGSDVGRGVIHCFVVRSLRDVDDPEQMRRGVHWHSQTQKGTHFVILSSIAGANVLAHELGHFLGNPKHSQVPGNLMSYQPGDGLPVLDAQQIERVARTVKNYVERRELKPVRATRGAHDDDSAADHRPLPVGAKKTSAR